MNEKSTHVVLGHWDFRNVGYFIITQPIETDRGGLKAETPAEEREAGERPGRKQKGVRVWTGERQNLSNLNSQTLDSGLHRIGPCNGVKWK